MANIEICYPNYSKKSLTFTIDDGNIAMDTKFIAIVQKGGIRGTFNLCSDDWTPEKAEFLRSFYHGYEIANHCKYHPRVMLDEVEYRYHTKDEADKIKYSGREEDLFYIDGPEGLYDILTAHGMRACATPEAYLRFVEQSRTELEAIFGEGAIGGFVWPFFESKNQRVKDAIIAMGYPHGLRKTGCVLDSTGFAPPADINAWSYNANNQNLLATMSLYENTPDDGELKFFAFGLHSYDFEVDDNWDVLERFTQLYGSRPEDYWYATVGEIFDYVREAKKLVVTDKEVTNNSSLPLYIKIDGNNTVVEPNSSIEI